VIACCVIAFVWRCVCDPYVGVMLFALMRARCRAWINELYAWTLLALFVQFYMQGMRECVMSKTTLSL
jgi:hypothetical protein